MEISGNFFDGIEQMITEAVMDDRVDTPQRRIKAIATRDFCQLVIRIIDSHSLTEGEPLKQAMLDRLDAAGSGIASAMGLFVAIGCASGHNTPKEREEAYAAISKDAEAFAKIIAEAMAAYVAQAKLLRAVGGRA